MGRAEGEDHDESRPGTIGSLQNTTHLSTGVQRHKRGEGYPEIQKLKKYITIYHRYILVAVTVTCDKMNQKRVRCGNRSKV